MKCETFREIFMEKLIMQECMFHEDDSLAKTTYCVHYVIKNTLTGVKAALSARYPLPCSIFSFLTRDTVLYDTQRSVSRTGGAN